MDCETCQRRLLDFESNLLTGAERAEVAAHLLGCPTCHGELELLRQARALLGTWEDEAPPPALAARTVAHVARAERFERAPTGEAPVVRLPLPVPRRTWSQVAQRAFPAAAACLLVASAALFGQAGALAVHLSTELYAPATLTPGAPGLVRVSVFDRMRGEPLAGARADVKLLGPRGVVAESEGTTDEFGQRVARLALPALSEGEYEWVATASDGADLETLHQGVHVAGRDELLLSTDRASYDRGAPVRARAQVRAAVTHAPVAGVTVRFRLHGGAGAEQLATTDAFGVATAALGQDVGLGLFGLEATALSASGETLATEQLTVRVGAAEPQSPLRIEVALPHPWLREGDALQGTVTVRSADGEPISGLRQVARIYWADEDALKAPPEANWRRFVRAHSSLVDRYFEHDTWREAPLGPAMTCQHDRVEYADGRVAELNDCDELGATVVASSTDGVSALEVKPSLRLDRNEQVRPARLWVFVEDPQGVFAVAAQTVWVARAPLLVTVVPEEGVLVPGVENLLRVRVSRPDGAAVAGALVKREGGADEAVSDADGMATLRFTPPPGPQDLTVTATVQAERATRALQLPSQPRFALVRTDKALYQAGETLAGEVVTPGQARLAFVDVLSDGEPVARLTVPLERGQGRFQVALPPSLSGRVTLEAYGRAGGLAQARHGRVQVFVQPKPQLQLALSRRAGGLDVAVTDAAGQPVQADLEVRVAGAAALLDEPAFAPMVEDVPDTLQAAAHAPVTSQATAALLFAAAQVPEPAARTATSDSEDREAAVAGERLHRQRRALDLAALGLAALAIGLGLRKSEGPSAAAGVIAVSSGLFVAADLLQPSQWVAAAVGLAALALGSAYGVARSGALQWLHQRHLWLGAAMFGFLFGGVQLFSDNLRKLTGASVNALASSATSDTGARKAGDHRAITDFVPQSTGDLQPTARSVPARLWAPRPELQGWEPAARTDAQGKASLSVGAGAARVVATDAAGRTATAVLPP
jgi:hypothetical protein